MGNCHPGPPSTTEKITQELAILFDGQVFVSHSNLAFFVEFYITINHVYVDDDLNC